MQVGQHEANDCNFYSFEVQNKLRPGQIIFVGKRFEVIKFNEKQVYIIRPDRAVIKGVPQT